MEKKRSLKLPPLKELIIKNPELYELYIYYHVKTGITYRQFKKELSKF